MAEEKNPAPEIANLPLKIQRIPPDLAELQDVERQSLYVARCEHARRDLRISAHTKIAGLLDPEGPPGSVRKASSDGMLLGVVSAAPGMTLGLDGRGKDRVPVALAGRVPVKISPVNGGIRAGTVLAPSPVPGRAARAIRSGQVLGFALEDAAPGADAVSCFINVHYWADPNESSIMRERLDLLEKSLGLRRKG